MAKHQFLVAAVFLATIFSLNMRANGAAVKEDSSAGSDGKPDFVYLGKFSDTISGVQGRKSRTSIQQQTSFYFKSQNAASWATAASDCKEFLGGTLLYIETEGELAAVRDFFESSDDIGSNYWIGGRYNGRGFSWENGVELAAWLPWASGHPNTRLSISRVSISTAGGLALRTQFQTVSSRYLCELSE